MYIVLQYVGYMQNIESLVKFKLTNVLFNNNYMC
jgi:hypothetical protein